MLNQLLKDIERHLVERADASPSPYTLVLNRTEIHDVIRSHVRDLVDYVEHVGGFEEWKKARAERSHIVPAGTVAS